MKKVYLSICALFLSFSGKAQLPDWLPGSPAQLQYIIVEDPLEDFEGDPFYEEQFTPGNVKVEGSEKLEVYLRYNAYKDQVYIKVRPNAESAYILPRTSQVSYQLNDYKYIFKKIPDADDQLIERYCMEFFDGDMVSLLGKPTARIINDRRESTVFADRSTPHMEVFITYYLEIGDGPLKEIRLKERDFKKVLNVGPEMEKYFKNNKVNDLNSTIDMLEYYENLDSI